MIVPLIAAVGRNMPTLKWLALTPDDVLVIEQTMLYQQYEYGCTTCSV